MKEREEANQRIDELQRQLELAAVESLNGASKIATDSVASNPLMPLDTDVLSLSEDDFVGVPQKISITAAKRGLDRAQAELLWMLRNGNAMSINELAERLGYSEHHPAKVLTDKLSGLGLIDLNQGARGLAFSISPAGTQALDAVMSRGFQPNSGIEKRLEAQLA